MADKSDLSDKPVASAHLSIGERVSRLAADCRDRDLTLRELQERIGGESPALLLMFLVSLPFCQPIPLLGLSTPLGLLLFFLGAQMARGCALRVPRRLEGVVIPRKFFPVLLAGAGRLMRWLEKHLHHGDAAGAVNSRAIQRLCGAHIALCALLLSLPVPIPFSNVFPAFPIALTAAALLERDNKMLLRSCVAAGANAIFWIIWTALIAWFGWSVVNQVNDWLF